MIVDIDDIDDLPWSCVIVDEAQRLKNPGSKLTSAFDKFASKSRFGLSGTSMFCLHLRTAMAIDLVTIQSFKMTIPRCGLS